MNINENLIVKKDKKIKIKITILVLLMKKIQVSWVVILAFNQTLMKDKVINQGK